MNGSPSPAPVMEVLFLCPWLPWPLNSGGKLRTFNLIKAVAPWARVHLRSVLEPGQGQADVDALAPYCASIKAFGREAPSPLMRLTHSKMERWFHSPTMIEAVRRELASEEYDVVHVDELLHARILPAAFENGRRQPPVVQHHHKLDTVFAKNNTSVSGLEKHFDAWKVHRLERESADRHHHHLLCSPDDAEILSGRYPRLACSVVPSGYDPTYFAPPANPPTRVPGELCFVGSMDYGPNTGAVLHFVYNVLPLIAKERPDVRFKIVGRNPTHEILSLASERIEVTGGVPDVRPWLSRASAMVVPLAIGGGTRLKIVEAMAMDCPIVSTSIGAEGLGLQSGRELALADNDSAFAAATLEALNDPAAARRMAQEARRYVEANLTWQRLAERLARVWRDVTSNA